MRFILTIILSLVLLFPQVFSQNTQITSFSKSKKNLQKYIKKIQLLSVTVVPLKVRHLTFLHVDIFQRKITNR